MVRIIEVIYENGVLRPLEPIEGLPENTRLRLTVEESAKPPHKMARFRGILSDEEAAELMQIIRENDKVDPNDWR